MSRSVDVIVDELKEAIKEDIAPHKTTCVDYYTYDCANSYYSIWLYYDYASRVYLRLSATNKKNKSRCVGGRFYKLNKDNYIFEDTFEKYKITRLEDLHLTEHIPCIKIGDTCKFSFDFDDSKLTLNIMPCDDYLLFSLSEDSTKEPLSIGIIERNGKISFLSLVDKSFLLSLI